MYASVPDDVGRFRRRPLARKSRRHAKPGQPDVAARAAYENVFRLEVLVDEATLVEPPQRGGQADGNVQERGWLHRASQKTREQLATGVFEQQRRAPVIAHQRQRPRCPCRIQLVPQPVLVLEPRQASRHGSLRGGRQFQDGRPAVIRRTSGEDEVAVLSQNLVMSGHDTQPSGQARSAELAVRLGSGRPGGSRS